MKKKRKKVLFAIPPITPEERYQFADVGYHMPPLGISYLAAILEQEKISVDIIDSPVLDLNLDEMIREIEKINPEIIGFTVLTPTFRRVVLAAEKIKEVFPEKTIMVGGHYPTIKKEELLRENENIDIVVYGEGEKTISELVRAILNGDDLSGIKGVIYRDKSGKIIKNKPRELIQELDKIPFPARHLLPMEKYKPAPHHFKELPVSHMIIARGCPYNCTFCSFTQVSGKKARYHSPGRVVSEMKHVIENYGVKEIIFRSEMISADREWLEELTDKLIEEDLNVRWSCYCRVDSVDPEILKRMKEAGCWQIFYGIESGVQELLDKVNKGTTIEQNKKAVKWTKEAGIEVRASFMLFMPGETPEMTKKTVDFAIELDPDYAQFAPTTPFPGTQLHREAEKYGELIHDHDKYTTHKLVFIPDGYRDMDQVKEMYEKSYIRFYRSPKRILRRAAKIRSWEGVKRHFNGLKVLLSLMNPFK